MKNMMKLVVLLLVSYGLAGCFQVDQVVTLSSDGSGTFEETFMISRKIAESMGLPVAWVNSRGLRRAINRR